MDKKQTTAVVGIALATVALAAVILADEPGKGAGHDAHNHAAHAEATSSKAGPAKDSHGDHADHGKGKTDGPAKDDHGHDYAENKAGGKTNRGDAHATHAAAKAGSQAKDEHGHDHDHADHKPKAAADRGATGAAKPDAHAGEEKVAMTDEQLRASGIGLDTARPARIATALTLPGEIRFNEDRTAHVVPRVAGVVEAVQATLGQQVARGQVLASIASTAVSEQRSDLAAAQERLALARETAERERKLWEDRITAQQDYQQARTALKEAEIAVVNARGKLDAMGVAPTAARGNRFDLRAPFAGMVLEKHVVLGEAVKEDTNLFTVSDLSTVWAVFNVPAKDLGTVRAGERAVVRATAMNAEVAGTVSYVGSLIGEQTRTAPARVVLQNPKGAWRPGLFVNVTVAASERDAAVTVPADAVQTIEERPTVFVRVPGGFEPRSVELGLSNGKRIEVTKGLAAGETVASSNSFVVRAELEKGSATHSH